jgi:hypothetical protein
MTMKTMRFVAMALLAGSAMLAPASAVEFDDAFTGKTMRLDVHHSGTAGEEHFSVDRVRVTGPWAGSRGKMLDDTNLGKYLLVVVDLETQQTIYSRGFASIFGEWELTREARQGVWRTVHESYRFPEPRGRAQVAVRKRTPEGAFREVFSTVVDPDGRFVDRAAPAPRGETWEVLESGPPASKVDLLFLGDGYTAKERDLFRKHVDRSVERMFSVEPFSRHREDFNVRALFVPAPESGISRPRAGVWRASPLGLSYNAFDSERYVLTFANRELREIAAQAPYDALILLANEEKYGGGGIFNLWMTAAARSKQFPYLLVHELGHSFAGLGDEYYTSATAYEDFTPPGSEPWEPNVTALLDPQELKWKALVDEDTPIPTPWNQERYDEVMAEFQKRRRELRAKGASEEEMNAYFAEVEAVTAPMLAQEEHAGEVGAFEGAGYRARGLYRPAIDCLMFTRNPDAFCPVCARAIERVITLYTE